MKYNEILIEAKQKPSQPVFKKSGADEYFRRVNYSVKSLYSNDERVLFGTDIPFKTTTGKPSNTEKNEFNYFNTYMMAKNER